MLANILANLASFGLIGLSGAVVSTSPMILASGLVPFGHAEWEHTSPHFAEVEAIAAAAVRECAYNAYIFVDHPNATSREINESTMPFLTRLLGKAAAKYVAGDVISSPTGDAEALETLQQTILSQCDALPVVADANSEDPLPAITDNKPRLITLKFPNKPDLGAVDETLKRTIGHLASANFFMFYHTTPRVSESPLKDSSPFFKILNKQDKADYESVFRNYQFFSPGLFMGFIVTGLLIVVFLIALKAVSSLQISQAAFEPKRDPVKKNQ